MQEIPVTGTPPHVSGYPITICTETRSICSAQILPACGRLLDSMRTGGPGSRMWTRGRSCFWPSVIAARSCTMGRQRRLERPGGSHPDDKAVALRHNAALNRSNECLVQVPPYGGGARVGPTSSILSSHPWFVRDDVKPKPLLVPDHCQRHAHGPMAGVLVERLADVRP
jgi:hypothetical protein